MDNLMITEKVLRDMAELMLDLQDSATRYDIINSLYRAQSDDTGTLFLSTEMCKALFGGKEVIANDDISDR